MPPWVAQLSLTFAVAMGLFCAFLAAACVTGSALGGWLEAQWGNNAAAGMAVITDALGLMLMHKIKLAK
jgi:predicted secreted hydrolase